MVKKTNLFNMENQVFRTEQMRSLIKKGVDTSNAKLYWCINKSNPIGRKKI